MSVQDAIAHPPLPGRARRFRVRYFLVRTLLVLLLLALVALLPGAQGGPGAFRYREGDIARERTVAPYDFRIEKDEPELRREQTIAAKAVTPVFTVDARASSDMLARYAEFQDSVLRAISDPSLRATDRVERLRTLNVPLSLETARALSSPSRARRMLVMLGPWLHDIYDRGVVDEKNGDLIQGYRTISLQTGESEQPHAASAFTNRREALAILQQRAANALGEDPIGMRAVAEVAAPFVQSNVAYNRNETDWRRLQARAAVPTTVGIVKKDELIVDANQKITRDALIKLRSLNNQENARRDPNQALYPPMSRVLLMLLLIAAFVTYLRMELPAVYRDNAQLAMLALLAAVTLTAAWLLVGLFGFSEFSVPIALAPLVVASLLEKRPALVYSMLLAVAAVNEFKAPQVAVAVLGGVTAVYSVSRLRHRWHFVRALFTLMAANVGGIVAWDLAHATTATLGRDAAWGVVNAFFSVSLAYMLLPVVENLFGLTSDITLLELSDLNRPLLRRLQLEAPGTYHHSMVVGSLAEAGTESIGANSLLARVSAYYHDIGKLSKSEYYAENEPVTSRSRHERLAPSMSALILRSHITEGLEMAKKHRLPKAVRDAIPEHHGTMVMAFFYVKALEVDPGARREDFSYPGPRPRTRENAILMLADGVEGAARALEDPGPSRIRGLVKRIIEERVQDGQLDDCGLTIQDLARIREAFIPVLIAVHHVRARYPDAPTAVREGREPERRRGRPDADLGRRPS